MALWGSNDQHSDAPKFVVDAATGETGQEQFGTNVFGVDALEVGAAGATVSAVGWIRRTEGTGGRAGRVQEEPLVVLSGATAFASGDADDFADTAAPATPAGAADDAIYPDA